MQLYEITPSNTSLRGEQIALGAIKSRLTEGGHGQRKVAKACLNVPALYSKNERWFLSELNGRAAIGEELNGAVLSQLESLARRLVRASAQDQNARNSK